MTDLALLPEHRDGTLGVVLPNAEMNTPAFAVDVHGGQGNGDVSDAVIGLRGALLDGSNASYEPDVATEITFVALDADDAHMVATILEAVARSGAADLFSEVTEHHHWRGSGPTEALTYIASRIRMTPGCLLP